MSAISAGDAALPDAPAITSSRIHNVYGPAANLMGSYLPEKMGIAPTFVGR
jgi:hypothetical protein